MSRYPFLVGKWKGVDEEGATFQYEYGADRTFTLQINRPDWVCNSSGTFELQPTAEAPARIMLTYKSNTCNDAYVGRSASDEVKFDATGFQLADSEAMAADAATPWTPYQRAQ